ncbi:MAG: hypothetical protein Q8M05_13085 [Rhodoferax sp.]|uniref:hypothetical protein n=1 Tax=Rhodoferax sp. TaxID=50421 RepID=UPI002730EFF2|nr:hypothetical protein [Rhodoferax sp.]MDP1530309.1 hypothetical protein [Rhodoferax sp.]MDP1943344.1 hypothetical protein [Rhodoferax sp.]
MSFAHYIGLPWQAGAQGPEAFDCMAFFRHVQREQFGVDVPAVIAPDYEDASALADLMSTHQERQRWLRIAQPVHGCAVLIHRPMHIGTWLAVDGGGVLHCARGAGVIFTSDSAWPCSGFGRKEYFRRAA